MSSDQPPPPDQTPGPDPQSPAPQQGSPQQDGGYPQQGGGQPQQGGYPQQDGGYQQPAYAQAPGGYAPQALDPGRTLGIVGLVLAVFGSLIGLIISIVALRKSKKAGFKNTPALAGVIIGIITTIITVVITATAIYGAVLLYQKCQDLGPGVHQVNGATFSCG